MTIPELRAGLCEWRWLMARRPHRRLRALSCMLAAVLEQRRHGPLPPPSTAANEAPALAFPETDEPVASIIIPVFNQPGLTRDCLRSIAAVGAREPFEVIVVDDASSDPRMEALHAIAGVTWLRNARNSGFIASCNRGAAQARGSVLVFLNNDTEVTPGWLDALLQNVQRQDVGMVGARLVYPDGRLQEAGGLVFADGSAWNYGRLARPDDPRYLHRRDADYCSGAAIAIERALFRQLDGFDTRYAPAYYEDTDLAMATRAAGLRVVCVPATVVHREGASAGTDVTRGMKAHQPINMRRFREKWRDQLSSHAPVGSDPDVAARDHGRRLTFACGRGGQVGEQVEARLLALADHGCMIDLHLHGDWPEQAVARLRNAGICVWPRDWLATARWHWWRTGSGMLLDDDSIDARAWTRRLSRDASPDAQGSLSTTLRYRGTCVDAAMAAPREVSSDAVTEILGALDACAGSVRPDRR